MENEDTIKLLKECDAGTKMAVASIDEVLEQVSNPELKEILEKSKNHHKELEIEIEKQLQVNREEDKQPNLMAKSMSWIKSNVKLGLDHSDATVADLITDGCDMGIKSLKKYLNKYQNADQKSKKHCRALIEMEEQLRADMGKYL